MTHIRRHASAIAVMAATFTLAQPLFAQRATYTVGVDGPGWRELASRWIALDDTTEPASVQPKELRPWENIMTGPEPETNLFGFQWHIRKTGLEVLGRELGMNPRVWGSSSDHALLFLDGDPSTSLPLFKVVSDDEWALTGYAWDDGFHPDWWEAWTFDLGFAVPVERIRFYPPQRGVGPDGLPYTRRAPQGFELSVAHHPQDFLLLAEEPVSPTSPHGPLEQVLLRTRFNSQSIVDLHFDLQPVRFVRLNLGLQRQEYTLAEFEVYGRGVPSRTEYVSRPIDLGAPANFGAVAFDFVTLRRTADGDLVDDSDAPVRLVLQTRTGHDDSPQSFFVIDKFGRDVEVSEAEYRRAQLPKECCQDLRLPGVRSAVTDDRRQWTPWSSPYDSTGESNRSADGRRWLQFRFEIHTDDVLAFGRLRSLRFELSRLLARTVVGEISLLERPELGVLEVPAGERLRYALDIRAEFDSEAEMGFDGARVDVPPDSRLLGLEMAEAGGGFTAMPYDSLWEDREVVAVYFPRSRVDARNNRTVRLVLEAAILGAATVFTGEVIDTQSENLPQSIESGDANGGVASDGLQVFAAEGTLRVLTDAVAQPALVTPNGDGINDVTRIAVRLMGIDHARLSIDIRDLGGRRVAAVAEEVLEQGSYEFTWAGTGAAGQRLPPGLYVCRLAVTTESGQQVRLLAVPVAY